MTAGQLIAALSKVDPDTPVVMSQEDEPCGDYGVRAVEFVDMQREPLYADGAWGFDTWHGCEARYPTPRWSDKYDPPRQVVFLGKCLPYRPIVDADVEQPALPGGLDG